MITGAKFAKSIVPTNFDCYNAYQDSNEITIQKCVGFVTCADGHISAVDFCDGKIQLANSFSNYKGTYTREEMPCNIPSLQLNSRRYR